MNHLASSVSARGSVWDKGTDRKQTLFETIKPYYTLMRKYIGEPRAWGKLGVLLPLPSTRAWPGTVLPTGSDSSFSSAVGLLSKPQCCKAFRQGLTGVHCPCLGGESVIPAGRQKAALQFVVQSGFICTSFTPTCLRLLQFSGSKWGGLGLVPWHSLPPIYLHYTP